jgi:nucleotide-binding universal stress UspA family protein
MYDTILVPLDGSKRSEIIINHITKLAQNFNSKLILLTAVEPRLLQGSEDVVVPGRSLSTTREETKKAETYLSNLQKELSQNDIQVETRVIAGSPAAVIKETAEQENADLIAIASHGRGGLARVFYGSVAAAILNQVDRPLLLVRSRNIKE